MNKMKAMKKIIFLFGIISCTTIHAQQLFRSTFNAATNETGDGIYIVGEMFNQNYSLNGNGTLSESLLVFTNIGSLHTSETELKNIALYPNPANEKVYWKSPEKIQTLIFDISGKLVLKSFDNQVDVSKLPAGTYIVKGQTSSGKIVTRKLVVQH